MLQGRVAVVVVGGAGRGLGRTPETIAAMFPSVFEPRLQYYRQAPPPGAAPPPPKSTSEKKGGH